MQTFLPYPSFQQSARALDYRRLGKQRGECIQILLALWYPARRNYDRLWRELRHKTCHPDPKVAKPAPYRNHPCTRMWSGYDGALFVYLATMQREWLTRGYKGPLVAQFLEIVQVPDSLMPPPWLGNRAYHSSHRAALLAKDPAHYSTFGWTETPRVDYVWIYDQNRSS